MIELSSIFKNFELVLNPITDELRKAMEDVPSLISGGSGKVDIEAL
jgi:hypothetical protein